MRVQILTAMATWPEAIRWFVVPLHSSTSDVVTLVRSPGNLNFLLAIFLAGVSLAVWVRQLRAGNEMVALGIAWVWIAFAPTSGIVPLNHLRAERYLSLSLFGFALLWPALGLVVGASSRATVRRFVLPALGVLLVLGLADRTWRRMPDWRSDKALFTSDVSRDPLYREGYFELAMAKFGEGDLKGAKASLEELSELVPAFATRTSYHKPVEAFGLYCHINLELGRAQDSLPSLSMLTPDSPAIASHPRVSLCSARTLHAVGESERAISILRAIEELEGSPLRAESALLLARVFADQERFEEALKRLDEIRTDDIRSPHLFFEMSQLRGRIRRELSGR
jgi:tetratricopeptide (TPR) repeat protein